MQLGFVEEYPETTNVTERLGNTFVNPNWSDWDGGKAGGKPIWLNPRDVLKPNDSSSSSSSPLKCSKCDRILHFVCQLYCPVENHDSTAFHRAMYVFLCPKSACRYARVLRCQMPRQNDFYSIEEEMEEEGMKPNLFNDIHFCGVCNQYATKRCPKQDMYFCCREHQVEHHAYTKKNNLPSCIYDEVEIVVEEEPEEDTEKTDDNNENNNELFKEMDDTEEDAELEQDDLNEMTGARGIIEEDPMTAEFYKRINRNRGTVRDQCLRYNSGWQDCTNNTILFTSSVDIPSSGSIDPPPCELCGEKRCFEFQVLPQLLHLIGVNSKKSNIISPESKQAMIAANTVINETEESQDDTIDTVTKLKQDNIVNNARETILNDDSGVIDFGTIIVYSCRNSCDSKNLKYIDEYAWVQSAIY